MATKAIYSAVLTAATEKRLIEAITKSEKGLIAREIREITGWDGTHFSIRNAMDKLAARHGYKSVPTFLPWTIEVGGVEVTREMLTYTLKALPKKAAADEKVVDLAAAKAAKKAKAKKAA